MSDKSLSNYTASQLPVQKVSKSKKTDSWRRECIDACLHIVGVYGSNRRSTKAKKQKNYDLYNGKFNKADLEYAANPLGIEISNLNFPASMQPYDCWNPVFQTLFGEEAKRQMSFIVRAVNEDAITDKEEKQKDQVLKGLEELLHSYIQNPEEANKPNQELEKYIGMSFQDMRESVATKILTYLKKDLNIEMIFQKGWEDALIAGEEIYSIETFSNEPKVRRCNPIEMYYRLPHNSDMIDDAEIIVESTYMSISEIIDVFYDKLTSEQVSDLENMINTGDNNFLSVSETIIFDESYENNFMNQSNIFDIRGNLRVFKMTWKSKKKIGRFTYLNSDTQEQEETIVTEDFKIDRNNPDEHVEWMWINEYWDGYKIGNDMYLDIKPKRLQYRRMDNLSTCKSGYVGTVYNCNNSQSVSLMDRLTPFIYLYIIMWYRLELSIAKNLGKIAVIDVSLIPDGWDIDKWMYYAQTMGMTFKNSFNEGNKGNATGKVVGNLGHSGNEALDLEIGNYIQHLVTMLAFIEQKLQKLSGVSDQRMGEISPSELVGNTERAVLQSSNITERWFQVHNFTKQRVLENLIEAAKFAWSGKTKKLQYVTDDLATVFFSVDGNDFNNSEYGVFVSNSAKDQEALNTVKQLMQAAIQNDKIELSSVIDVLSSESTADIKNKLLQAEQARSEQTQKAQQAEQEHEKQIHDEALDIEKQKLDLTKYIADEANRIKIQVAEIGALSFDTNKDENNNSILDVMEVEAHALAQQELASKNFLERSKLDHEKKKHERETQLKEKELKIKERDTIIKAKAEANKVKVQKATEELKAKTALRIAKLRPKPKSKS